MAKIMVVDDSKTVRAFARAVLERDGHQVIEASDIWISNSVRVFQPDLILVDENIGEQKGHVAVRALKKRPLGSGICMVLYSTETTEKLNKLVQECKADGYLPKDGSDATLSSGVKNFLQRFYQGGMSLSTGNQATFAAEM